MKTYRTFRGALSTERYEILDLPRTQRRLRVCIYCDMNSVKTMNLLMHFADFEISVVKLLKLNLHSRVDEYQSSC